jgi:hypothetical protein
MERILLLFSVCVIIFYVSLVLLFGFHARWIGQQGAILFALPSYCFIFLYPASVALLWNRPKEPLVKLGQWLSAPFFVLQLFVLIISMAVFLLELNRT